MTGWLVATVECRVCSDKHVSVYPADIAEEDNQECARCRSMSCEPTAWFGRDGVVIPRNE